MKAISTNKFRRSTIITAVGVALSGSAGIALAWDVPSGLNADDDALVWQSNAPSFNIYEDGMYIATIHGISRYEPIFDNSVYTVVAHDHGEAFTTQSVPFLYIDDEENEENEDEILFDELEIYFELNNTDGDLGIHSVVDGEPWTHLVYEDRNGRALIDVQLTGAMAAQGITEFFFESAEPTFDELAPSTFFARFPDGVYDVEGLTIEGEEVEGEAILSSVLPSAPSVYIGDQASAPNEGCNDDSQFDPAASLDMNGRLPVSWDAVTTHHPTLGTPGEVEIDSYLLVLEGVDSELSIKLDADLTSFALPAALVDTGDNVKIEVIAIDATHNQVATEACANVI